MTTPTTSPHELFSSRETLEEAIAYSTSIIDTLPLEHRMTASTALWVSLNTAIKKIASLDLTQIQPIPIESLPQSVKLSALPKEELLVMIRTLIAPTISQLHIAHKLPLVGELVEGPSSFVAMVALAFGLTTDEVIAEVRAYRQS